MSTNDVKAFYKKVAEDKKLKEKLVMLCGSINSKEEEEVIKIAAEAGFKFTSSDLTKVGKEGKVFFPGEDIEIKKRGKVSRYGLFGRDCHP
jgi:predicted ribosomally synthesized peptide with nif11-like leader